MVFILKLLFRIFQVITICWKLNLLKSFPDLKVSVSSFAVQQLFSWKYPSWLNINMGTGGLVFPIYKTWLLWRKEKKATFWIVQAGNRLRPCPDPMPVHKADSIPHQWTALTSAYKTPWCSALQGTNTLSTSLRFCQHSVTRKFLCSQEMRWAIFFWAAVFWNNTCKQNFTAANKYYAVLI